MKAPKITVRHRRETDEYLLEPSSEACTLCTLAVAPFSHHGYSAQIWAVLHKVDQPWEYSRNGFGVTQLLASASCVTAKTMSHYAQWA